jgi:hypothetical protein
LDAWLTDHELRTEAGEAFEVASARLYKADTDDVRQAHDLARAGQATLIDELLRYADQKAQRRVVRDAEAVLGRPIIPDRAVSNQGTRNGSGAIVAFIVAVALALLLAVIRAATHGH